MIYRIVLKSSGYLACIIISAFISVYIVDIKSVQPRPIFTLDISKVILNYSNDLASQNLDKKLVNSKAKQFSQNLLKKAQLFAKQNNAVILVSDATIAGAQDITEIFSRSLSAGKK